MQQVVVACASNPATLETEFRNSVGLIPVGTNSRLVGKWIVLPLVTLCKERNLIKYCDLADF